MKTLEYINLNEIYRVAYRSAKAMILEKPDIKSISWLRMRNLCKKTLSERFMYEAQTVTWLDDGQKETFRESLVVGYSTQLHAAIMDY